MIDEGRQTFRFATFGDEAFWGGQLHRTKPSKVKNSVAWGLA